ncbi:MAG: branched-chain amino acid transaminase [Ignavibacteria bacterium]|nr:branched-chain amino acid transaminase [Ignavibacteria bacterium]
MPIEPTNKIWRNGEFIPFHKASVHVLSHALHYGTSWFEGIRAYETAKGTAVFRLQEHMQRFQNSLKVYRTVLPYRIDELSDAVIKLLQVNDLKTCYIRPFAMRGFGDMGVYALRCPLEVYIASWAWGGYLGEDAVEKGVDVCVSSWDRITPNSLPSIAKAGGNYMNSQLVKMEAIENGYAEGICLDAYGNVAEGSGENVFVVIDGVLVTPPASSSLLPGITRETVVTLARQLGIPVVVENISRASLYVADEMFLTGTAVEITPVTSVDRIAVGRGRVGPLTKKIQKAFQKITVMGEDPYGWLTFVPETKTSVKNKKTKA